MTARRVGDGQAGLQVGLGRIEGGVVEAGEEKTASPTRTVPRPENQIPPVLVVLAVVSTPTITSTSPISSRTRFHGLANRLPRYLRATRETVPWRVDGEPLHEQQADQDIEKKGQRAEKVGECRLAQATIKFQVTREIDVVGQVQGTEHAGIEDQEHAEGKVEQAEGRFQPAQGMLPCHEVVVVEHKVRTGEKSADRGADQRGYPLPLMNRKIS